jgi:hypothetical protein
VIVIDDASVQSTDRLPHFEGVLSAELQSGRSEETSLLRLVEDVQVEMWSGSRFSELDTYLGAFLEAESFVQKALPPHPRSAALSASARASNYW